jgi:hypothetical protein
MTDIMPFTAYKLGAKRSKAFGVVIVSPIHKLSIPKYMGGALDREI